MKTLTIISSIAIFIASILFRPSVFEYDQDFAEFNRADYYCNLLLVVSFLLLIVAFIFHVRELRYSSLSQVDDEYYKSLGDDEW